MHFLEICINKSNEIYKIKQMKLSAIMLDLLILQAWLDEVLANPYNSLIFQYKPLNTKKWYNVCINKKL
jgi:hypothetical protein